MYPLKATKFQYINEMQGKNSNFILREWRKPNMLNLTALYIELKKKKKIPLGIQMLVFLAILLTGYYCFPKMTFPSLNNFTELLISI